MTQGKEDKLILVTNDDGIHSPGLKMLFEIMKEFGKVVMISSKEVMSGKSMAITVVDPLRAHIVEETDDYKIYLTNGTPTDCVKLSINSLLDRKPDMIVSGINQGANSSVSVLYSGTMGAVIEGCLYGIDSIGFSLDSYSSKADYSVCIEPIRSVVKHVLDNPLPKNVCLNVNIPALKVGELKGMKICRQSVGNWKEEFVKRTDPIGKDYYWLTGKYNNHEPDAEDTDEWALEHGYVSVVPQTVDMTAFNHLDKFKVLESYEERKIG